MCAIKALPRIKKTLIKNMANNYSFVDDGFVLRPEARFTISIVGDNRK